MSREIRSFVYGREYIPTSLAESSTCRLLVVTDDQIEILRNLVNYAHQRRSWNDETIDDTRYYMPSDEDWDDIEALVADLEDKLMSECDYVTLDDANERLGIGTTSPDTTLEVVAEGPAIAKIGDGAGLGLVVDTNNATLDAESSITLDASHVHIQNAGVDVVNILEAAPAGIVGVCVAAPNSRLDIGAGAITLAEMTPPGTTPADMCVLFVKDDGTGKTALIAKFHSVSRVLATE